MENAHYNGLGLLAQLMGVEILSLLAKKKVIDLSEAKEIVDRCLLNLELRVAKNDPGDELAFLTARETCETLLALLDKKG